MKHADFLVEIQTEELPPKALYSLANHFCDEIQKGLAQQHFSFATAEWFATPRRLAVRVNQLLLQQPDSMVEKKGPAWAAAFDATGKPTPALLGFAKSSGVSVDELMTIETAQGKWAGVKQHIQGKSAKEVLPTIVQQALIALPIPKRMRWGNHVAEFVRPVHSVIMLLDSTVVQADILGHQASNKTSGHRFHCKKPLTITHAKEYEKILASKGHVLADFEKRKNKIVEEVNALVTRSLGQSAKASMSEALLNEVTSLVEWPVALLGKFDESFLNVPNEVLICSMQDHQRYFPLQDSHGKLLPYFVTLSNLESKNAEQVIHGNERVLRARLSDAAFFYETDKKTKLNDRVEKLSTVLFQAKLGTLLERAKRISQLAGHIATQLTLNRDEAMRAGLLAKADLTTDLVGEFPELQGIAGYYYALHDHESSAVASAIKEHYQPRFAGDALPASLLGAVVALADRLDTLVGVFGIGLLPTGEKDPFGLRRAALGALRIVIEKQLPLDMVALLNHAVAHYAAVPFSNQTVVQDVWQYMQERLKNWYQDQAVGVDIFAAVTALKLTKPYDIHCRIQAVKAFKNLSASASLSIANKRVSNILSQYHQAIHLNAIDEKLFEQDAERALASELIKHATQAEELAKREEYQQLLTQLANLREPVDTFFDQVMVMTEDEPRRENRLLLLKKLRELFLKVADIALLQ